ncbi:MAG: alcohol dehydrogenase catalytic domain-containing protein, partial [Elusimicrobia bacterium]|nr:alcohol dehydrogenase catalytic domain-containing protein [Elusimicrobiota bacterium]
MKALVKDGAELGVREARRPEPGPGQVLVRVAVAAVCRTDLYAAEGRIPSLERVILGHELSGVVAACGRGAALPEGTRVAVMPVLPCGACALCRDGRGAWCPRRQLLGVDRDGAFAEYVAVPAGAVHPLPADLPFELAAYAEPVAASLAILKAGMLEDDRGVLYGDNRISRLNERVLAAHGVRDVTVHAPGASPPLEDNAYDFAVESLATPAAAAALARAVRPGGVIVLRSRWRERLSIPLAAAVEKELRFHAVHYGPFEDAVRLVA